MIYIVFDTNFLHIPENVPYKEFKLNREFDAVLNLVSSDGIRDNAKILLPEIVLKELWKQRCDGYTKEWIDFKNKMDTLNGYIEVKVSVSRDAYPILLSERIEEYIRQFSYVEMLPVCGNDYFPEIVQRAVSKLPPFEGNRDGKGKESDKGFKDTVLYYSLIDYAKKNPGEYYLLAHDHIFHRDDGRALKAYFKKSTGQTLCILDKSDNLDVELKNEMGSFIDYVETLMHPISYNRGSPVHEPIMKVRIPKILLKDKGRSVLMRINRDIESLVDQVKLEWDDVLLSPGPYWPSMEYEGKLDTEILFNRSGLISILFKTYTYVGGAHGGRQHIGKTYSLNTGREVRLTELLGVSEEVLINKVTTAILADKQAGEYDYFEDYIPCYSNEEEVNYFLDEDGVKIILGEYEAGCYASGIHHVLLAPLSELHLPSNSEN